MLLLVNMNSVHPNVIDLYILSFLSLEGLIHHTIKSWGLHSVGADITEDN